MSHGPQPMRFIDKAAQSGRWKHRPAGEKLLICLGIMTVSLSVADWIGQVLIIELMLILTVGIAEVPFRDWVRAALVPSGFIFIGVLTLFVSIDFADGRPSLFLVSKDNMVAAAFVGIRSFACVTALIFLALTTPLSSLMSLFQRLGVPRDITEIAMLMFRFVWLLVTCLESGHRAQSARLGYAKRTRWIRSSAMLAAGLLPRALDRARRMNVGLQARGYDGTLKTLSLEQGTTALRLGSISLIIGALGGLVAWIG